MGCVCMCVLIVFSEESRWILLKSASPGFLTESEINRLLHGVYVDIRKQAVCEREFA